ncbi:MAG: hypothetical protein PHS14_07980 [Elusimicrobia bacterium]|nr:hypothetical protein [Elusimicrobiota bacterium]
MLTKVVARLKTGSIKNVVPFGSPRPAAPYVVVKEEKADGNRTRFRIMPHMAQSAANVLKLDEYTKSELSDLLSTFESDDRFGNHFRFEEPEEREWMGVGAVSDDNTISMERCFYAPLLLF